MDRSEKLPTYAEIARKAGVSTKTGCNVFRYPDIVRRKTGQKVFSRIIQAAEIRAHEQSWQFDPGGY